MSLHFLLPNPATVFLELWKRERATVVTEWKLHEWDEDEVRTSSFLLGASLFRSHLDLEKTYQRGPLPRLNSIRLGHAVVG